MSVWSTKSFDRGRKYVILKHTVPGVNNVVNGVKFRGGYAVVEKDSKVYHQLRRMPFLQKASEMPLTFLGRLKFITRTSDIKMVYGQDVYLSYLAELEESKKVGAPEANKVAIAPVEPPKTCKFTTKRGTLCKYTAMPESPSGFCTLHILQDTGLASLGIEIPESALASRKEKDKLTDQVIKKLRSGKFKPVEPKVEAVEAAPVPAPESTPEVVETPVATAEPEKVAENG